MRGARCAVRTCRLASGRSGLGARCGSGEGKERERGGRRRRGRGAGREEKEEAKSGMVRNADATRQRGRVRTQENGFGGRVFLMCWRAS